MSYQVLTEHPLTTVALTAAKVGEMLLLMGWVVADDMTASSYIVYSSNGEAGDKEPLYLIVNWSGSTVALSICTAWNATSHSTTGPTDALGYLAANKNLWMHGSKNTVFISQETAGTMSVVLYLSHIVNPPADAVTTTTTASASIGTSVSIPVTSVVGFEAGARYQIFDPVTGYRQPFTCESVGVDYIIADALVTNGSGPGSLVGSYTFTAVGGNAGTSSVAVGGQSINGHRCVSNSFTNASCSITSTGTDVLYKALSSPYLGSLARRRFFPIIVVEDPTNSYQYIGDLDDGNESFYYAPVFSASNLNDGVALANYDAIYLGLLDSGTTTGSNTVTTLNDTSKSWGVNAHAGKVLVCTGGAEIGQIRKIISNTATELTVTPDFKTIPVSSTYVISDRGYRHYNSGMFLREGV